MIAPRGAIRYQVWGVIRRMARYCSVGRHPACALPSAGPWPRIDIWQRPGFLYVCSMGAGS
jgi:hypothetical protein